MRNPETPRSVRQLTECPWSLSTLSGAARGCRSVLGVSVGPGVSQESPGLPECPWSLFRWPARGARFGVSWESPWGPEAPGLSLESPGLPECPWRLFELPGGARGHVRVEKRCPRSVRAARRLLGVSGAHKVSLETPDKKRAGRVSGSLRLFPECPGRLRS